MRKEQDKESPHRYFSENCDFPEGGIFLDVGAAEGMISLDVVEKASEIYLMEASTYWIDTLKKTFEPYRNKVHIVRKLIGDADKNNIITIDSLLSSYKDRDIFVKMDIEGMELEALYGAQRVMTQNKCRFSCAAYHTFSMETDLKRFFRDRNYNSESSQRYMLFMGGASTLRNGMLEKLTYPYFRKGIVRAWPKERTGEADLETL